MCRMTEYEDDSKLYNVYAWDMNDPEMVEHPQLEESGLYLDDARKFAYEILERGPSWDSYVVDMDLDAGPFMVASFHDIVGR